MTNFASASNGATIAASSTYALSAYNASYSIDGNRTFPSNWSGSSGGIWHGAGNTNSDSLTVLFATTSPLSEINVFTVPDSFTNTAVPVANSTTFTSYGATGFVLQYLKHSTGAWTTVATVAGNFYQWKQFSGLNITDADGVRISNITSPDGYGRVCEIEALGILPAVSKWSQMSIIPKSGLEAWNGFDTATDGATAFDYSGSNRNLVASSALPALQTIPAINNQKAVYFSGSNNPLTYTGSLTIKHLFIVAAYDGATFGNFAGLFTGISDSANDILIGSNTTDIFLNLSYSGFAYKKNDVLFAAANEKAPVNNQFGIIECAFPAGFAMSGMTIGQQRNVSGTKWKGFFAESIAYSRVLGDCERMDVYRYLAMKFFAWRETSAGLKIFPFANDKKITHTPSKVILESASVSGAYKARSKSGLIRSFDAGYGFPRRQEEFDAAEEFSNQVYPGASCAFEDNSVYPARIYPARMTQMPVRDSDNYFHSYSIKFQTTA